MTATRRVWIALSALALVTTLTLAGEAPPREGGSATRLERGRELVGTIAGAREALHQVSLGAGQVAVIEIEHDPVEPVVRVIVSGGTVDLERRALPGERRTKFELVAEHQATFGLRMTTAYPNAEESRYRIRVRALRRLSERDRALHGARRLQAEASRLLESGDIGGARTSAERSLEAFERVKSPDDAELGSLMQLLGSILHEAGYYQQADAMLRRALELETRAFGAGHPAVAAVRDHLARNLGALGRFGEAEQLATQAITALEASVGPDHFLVATALSTLAGVYTEQRELPKAEVSSNRALETAGKTYGPDTLRYQWFATQTAAVQTRRGRFDRAAELLEHAMKVRENLAAAESLDVADSLFGIAFHYLQKRDNLKSAEFGERALRLQEALLGPDHPRLSDTLSNLGLLSLRTRDFRAAEELFLRAARITESSLGPNHYSLARAFNNLGLVYWRQGDYPKATAQFRRTLEIVEAAFGPDSPNIAPALANLGIMAKETGDYDRAEAYYQRSLAIFEKTHGPSHPQLIVPVESLGILYRDRGDYARAEPYFLRVLEMSADSLGSDHPEVARTLGNLAQLYAATGERSKARAALARRATIEERILPLQLAVGSERQKLAYLAPFKDRLDELLSFQVHHDPENGETRDLAVATVLQRKGRVLEVMADSLGGLRERSSADERALLDELADVTSRLGTLVLRGPGELSREDHQREIDQLGAKRDRIESELSRRTAGYFEPGVAVTLQSVRAAIPPDAVLLEFVVYRPFDPKAAVESSSGGFGEPRYLAYVLSRDEEVRWRDLGPVAIVDERIDVLRRAFRDPGADPRAPARALDALIMEPVRAVAGDPKHLLIAPDGQLNLIPFEALVDERGGFLVERFGITYLNSGRDLLRMKAERSFHSGPLVVANPAFGERPAPRDEAAMSASLPRAASSGNAPGAELAEMYFTPLAGTAHEARSIKALFPEASILTRSEATEASVKRAAAPRILHIATHGFFLGDAADGGAGSGTATRALRARVNEENPLLRSGLAFTGANLDEPGGDDGILTALEASSLDLWGTELVTLSACDTGVGEVRNGEGVYGLRRAFFLAGTETLVMSLWPVSDYVTRKMMTGYYSGLKKGRGRGDALRQAQLAMLKLKGRRHPFYWASFIQSGDWRSLEGR